MCKTHRYTDIQPQEKMWNFGSDKGDIGVLPWPLWTSPQLRSAGMIQPGVLLQMDPAGFLNMHKYCTSKQITSIGNANIITTKKDQLVAFSPFCTG